MKSPFSLCVAALFVHLGSLAQPASSGLKESYQIAHGGRVRTLSLASDAVAEREPDGRRSLRPLPAGPGADMRARVVAERAKAAAGSEIEVILREKSVAPKKGAAPRDALLFVTRRILVKLAEGASADGVARRAGAAIVPSASVPAGWVILEAAASEEALVKMETLRGDKDVAQADVFLAMQKAKKFTPNDPLFGIQWHHRNTTQEGGALWVDSNITTAWDSAKGAGITIGILDDGVEHAHPDIQPAYNTAIDYDFNSVPQDDDPTPVDLVADTHGTACAGVAGARGNNGIGVAGAAPLATLAGFRLIAAPNTDQDEADAFSLNNNVIHVKSNSWGAPDDGFLLGPGPLAAAALQNGATSGRGGLGTIYVFAAGNGLDVLDNSNYDGYANSNYVIAVSAINDFGFQSWYSEPGANIIVAAPSNGGGHNAGIVTTDLAGENGDNKASVGTGDLSDRSYTNGFGGTSSACPLVAGVVALMLEANPNLGWRDVQEILIRSARKIHRTDPDWSTNGAGISFNHKYGAGCVDAAAAVALAQQWTNLGTRITATQSNTTTSAIPDNSTTGVTRALAFSNANFRVERVTVTVNATHTALGDLEVTLTSPSGMVSKLAEAHEDDTNNLSWTYSSVRHWGENAFGNWTVKVADRVDLRFDSATSTSTANTGSLTGVTVTLHGSTVTAARIAGASTALTAEQNTPSNSQADPGETVTFSLGLKSINGATTSNLTATLLPIGGASSPSAPQNYGALAAGGATVTRSFTFRAQGGCGMFASLILRLQDGATDLGYASLAVPLGTSASNSFTGGAITINDKSVASPSPSNLSVTGLSGRVQGFTAQANGFTHGFVDDVGMLLAGPDALRIRLMCGGYSAPESGRNYTFSDLASIAFPYDGPTPSGSYKPWDWYGSSRTFTGAPAVEAAFSMGEFLGVPANGTWKLYVQDFGAQDAGSMTSWALNFTTVTCTDNMFFTQAATSGGEGAGSLEVSVTRTGGKEGTATVNYATSNGTAQAGSDYTAASGTLTFGPGELVKTFSIPITDDGSIETDETINVTLSSASGESTLGTLSTGLVTIQDDDTPTPVMLSPATLAVNEAGTSLIFTVSRALTGTAGSVSYATTAGTAAAGSDFTSASGSVTFAAADTSKTFTVALLNDADLESPESFTVSLSAPTGGLSLGSPVSSTVTITDGDADTDGMPDDYETSVGLNAAVNDAALDLDGDGFTNFQEFIMGTLPNSGTSLLRPQAAPSGADIVVSFPTVIGRAYKVEWSQTLANPWTVVQQGIPGTGGTINVPDTGATSQPRRFYHVVVSGP